MKRDVALWTGLLTGPIVWFISLESKFAISWWVCTSRWKPAVFAISFLALAITVGAGLLSWSQWKQLGDEQPAGPDQVARPHAMAIGGVLLSGGFLLVLIAQMLPELLMSGCE